MLENRTQLAVSSIIFLLVGLGLIFYVGDVYAWIGVAILLATGWFLRKKTIKPKTLVKPVSIN